MTNLGVKFSKEDVFSFNSEIKELISLLNGTTLYCKDEFKLKQISKQIIKLEQLSNKFEPTLYDEYSLKVKYAYKKMIKLKGEYERVIREKCFNETIEEYKNNYYNSYNVSFTYKLLSKKSSKLIYCFFC